MAPRDVAGPAKKRGKKAADKREIGRQATEIIRLNEDQQEIFAAMLADMDSRIDEVVARTDRLLAQYFEPDVRAFTACRHVFVTNGRAGNGNSSCCDTSGGLSNVSA